MTVNPTSCAYEKPMWRKKNYKYQGMRPYTGIMTSNSGEIIIAVKDNQNNKHASKARNRSRADIMDTTK